MRLPTRSPRKSAPQQRRRRVSRRTAGTRAAGNQRRPDTGPPAGDAEDAPRETRAAPRPTSPMNARAGGSVDGEKRERRRSERRIDLRRRAGHRRRDRVGGESADRHHRREPVAAVHEVEKIRRPRRSRARSAPTSRVHVQSAATAHRAPQDGRDDARRRAWTARRGTGCTPRQSSTSDTTATASHAASQTGVATAATGGDSERDRDEARPDREPADPRHRPVVERAVGWPGLRQASRPTRGAPAIATVAKSNETRIARRRRRKPKSATERPGARCAPRVERPSNRRIPDRLQRKKSPENRPRRPRRRRKARKIAFFHGRS